MNSDDLVICTEGLSKSFGEVHAFKSLDLRAPQKSIFAFLGPNGAGKTTTIKLLLGLLKPTRGGGKILGMDILRDSVDIRARIGHLPQDTRFYEHMTAHQIGVSTMKHIFVLCLVIFTGLLLTGCGSAAGQAVATSTPLPIIVAENVIVAEGRLEPVRFVDMAFNANGTVSEVLVSDGEQVTTGQVIARLENSEAKQAEVANAEEAFLQAQQAFDSAEVTALGKLAEAHESVRKAQQEYDYFTVPSELRNMTTNEALQHTSAKLDEARANFEPYKYLEERLASELERENPANPDVYRSTAKNYKKQLDSAWANYNKAIKWAKLESNLENARAETAKAQKEYDLLSSGSDADEKAVAEARYEAARANLAAAQAALADVELRAPFDGRVAGLKVKVGETVSPGQIAASLADFSGWIIKTTDLTELDVVSISEGQPVQIELDAFPEDVLNGKVQLVGQNYSEKQGDIVYEVTVALSESLPDMRWGMTTLVKFTK